MINNKVKIYRVINDMNQEQLANLVGVTRQTIGALENNKYNPSLELGLKIAKVFDVKVEDIFEIKE